MENSLKEIFNNFDTGILSLFLKKKEVGISLCMTGLNNPLRLLVLNKIINTYNKKVLFITTNEQSALKYSQDLESIFNINSKIFPFQ